MVANFSTRPLIQEELDIIENLSDFEADHKPDISEQNIAIEDWDVDCNVPLSHPQ